MSPYYTTDVQIQHTTALTTSNPAPYESDIADESKFSHKLLSYHTSNIEIRSKNRQSKKNSLKIQI